MDSHNISEKSSHGGHYISPESGPVYSDLLQSKPVNVDSVPPIHRVLIQDQGLIDISALRNTVHQQYYPTLPSFIKSELMTYNNDIQEHMRVEYTGSPTHYTPRSDDISTELLKMHQNNLVNAELAAASISQPLNLQQGSSSQYKHPMLHLYDAAMQQQKEEEYKHDIVSSSSDSTDSSSDDDTESPNKSKESPVRVETSSSVPIKFIVPKSVTDIEDKSSDESSSDEKCTDESMDTSKELDKSSENVGSSATTAVSDCVAVTEAGQKTPYDCGNCGSCFIVQCGTLGHKVVDIVAGKYICSVCRGCFDSVELLQTHFSAEHGDKQAVDAPVDLRSPKKHESVKSTTEDVKYVKPQCRLCGQKFNSKASLHRHEKNHMRKSSHICTLCSKKFLLAEDLTEHSLHACRKLEVKQIQCDMCDRVFIAESGLLSHKRATHKIGVTYKCHVCKSRFESVPALDVHLETHIVKTEKKDLEEVVDDDDYDEKLAKDKKKVLVDDKERNSALPSGNTKSTLKTKDVKDETTFEDFAVDDSDTEDDLEHMTFETMEYLEVPKDVDENVEKHLEQFTENLEGGILGCAICDKKFKTKRSLKSHVREHFFDEYKESLKFTEIDEKLKASTGPERYRCHICDKSFPSSFHLGLHITSHKCHITQDSQGENFKCSVCGDGFSYKSCLKKHMKRKHGNKTKKRSKLRELTELTIPKCKVCGRVFKDFVNLRRHAIVHDVAKQFPCPQCGKCFSRHDGLRAHVRTHTGEKPYKCGVCGMCCATSSGLNIHKKSHNDNKPFGCEICGKVYKYRLSLNLHITTHNSTKPFNCDICNKSFYDPSSFKKHKVIHTGVKSHICHICGNSFFRRESLTKHLKTHNPNFTKKLHPCPQCPKIYNAASGLIIHRRTHSGEKPFQCEFCSRYFATKSTLLSHSRTHSGVKPYVCEFCGKSFIQATPLKMHMKRVHSPDYSSIPIEQRLPIIAGTSQQLTTTSKTPDIDLLPPTQVPTSYAYELMYAYNQSITPHTDVSVSSEPQWHSPVSGASQSLLNPSPHGHITPGSLVSPGSLSAPGIDRSTRSPPFMEHNRMLLEAQRQGLSLTSLLNNPVLNSNLAMSHTSSTNEQIKSIRY